jgi:hypothetical protein
LAEAIGRHPANTEIVAIDPFVLIIFKARWASGLHRIGINRRLGYWLRALGQVTA